MFRRLTAAAAVVCAATAALAAQPQFWKIEGAREFLEGDTEGLSVDSEGRVRLAPAAKPLHDPDPQIKLMNMLSPYLKEGGAYFMEDVCPYKMVEGDLHRGIYDHIRGYGSIAAGSTPKPEVLVIAVK